MAGVIVDLSEELRQARLIAESILDQQVGPWIEGELHEKWPRRTGASASAWGYSSGVLANNVEYTDNIRTRDGLAVDSVLQPITVEAAARRWTE